MSHCRVRPPPIAINSGSKTLAILAIAYSKVKPLTSYQLQRKNHRPFAAENTCSASNSSTSIMSAKMLFLFLSYYPCSGKSLLGAVPDAYASKHPGCLHPQIGPSVNLSPYDQILLHYPYISFKKSYCL